jgi:uncharacterized protein (TIGR03435 family)
MPTKASVAKFLLPPLRKAFPRSRVRRLTIGACVAFQWLAQAQGTPEGPRFEVAAIKASDPNPSTPMFIGMSADGSMVRYTNITLRDCIRGAYRVSDFQIVGPDWMRASRFEIDAKLPADASVDQIPEMLRALLVERFKLEVRQETKEQQVYALVIGQGGAKLKPSQVKADSNSPKALGPDGKPREPMMYGFPPGGVSITAPSASLTTVAGLMSLFTARPVVDMTGIEGQYEFKMIFQPERNGNQVTDPPAGNGGELVPSVFDAVKDYGLRLEARKAPIEMITVTHLEKTPTEN